MLKIFTLFIIAFSTISSAQLPNGTYHLQQAICQNGVILNMDWPMVTVEQSLVINNQELRLFSHIKKRSLVPYNIDCSIESQGHVIFNPDNSYLGAMTKVACSCTVKDYEERTCAREDGEYSEGLTFYEVLNDNSTIKLTRESGDPYQKYCKKEDSDLPPTLVFSK